MIIASHSVTPEEVMEYLDGELSNAAADAIGRHLDICPECAGLANQFRATSHSLAQWAVPSAPEQLDSFFQAAAAGTAAGKKIGKPKSIFFRATFWTRKQWTFGGASVLVGALILFVAFAFVPRNQSRSEMALYNPRIPSANTPQDKREGYAYEGTVPTPKPGATIPSTGPESKEFDRVQLAAKLFTPPASASPSEGLIRGYSSPESNTGTLAPMIARAVSLSIAVKDFNTARAALDAILARHHGYAAELTLSTPENSARSFTTSLRIPASQLDAAIADLRSLGHVEFEKQTGEEVTQQHADLVARLKNSREEETRLQAILQQRTGKIEDVLQVEEEIARVRGEIESMESDQKALEHRVDFTSIDLELKEEYKEKFDTPSNPASTALHNALVDGVRHAWNALLGIVLWFAEFGPTLLILGAVFGVPAILLWRRYRRMLATL